MKRTTASLLAVFAAASPLSAQQQGPTRPDSVYRVEGISAQATRPIMTTGGASAIEVKLDSMRMLLPTAPTLGQVLRELPMLYTRTNSRGELEITARGSESRQVAVLLDGVPLTLAWDARMDASVIPATAPQQITFVRGLSSILYGPNTLGGIIEVDVAQGVDLPAESIELTAGADHVGGYGTTATLTSPFRFDGGGTFVVRAGAGWRSSPGMPLAADVSEPVPTDDDLRLNTDFEQFDGFLAMRYNAPGGAWLSFSGTGSDGERGIAAELGVAEPRLWRYPTNRRVIGVLSGGTGFRETPFGGLGDIEASIGIDVGKTEIDSYTSRAYDAIDGTEIGNARTLTLRLLGDHSLGEHAELRSAFTFVTVNHEEIIDGEAADYRQRLWSAGLETVVRPGGRVRLSVGAVVDGSDTPEAGGREEQPGLSAWGGRIGVTAPLGRGNTVAHAGLSRRARFPALRELYSGALGRFEPNPDLEPERMTAAEAGITTRVGNGELQVVGFHHRMDDAVVRAVTVDGQFRRENRNRLESTGLEVALSGMIGPVGLAGDMTWQTVDLTDTEAGTVNEPENMPSVYGGITARVPLPAELAASLAARYTGEQFCIDPDSGADRELEGAALVDLNLGRSWRVRSAGTFSQLETGIAVDNIFDRALYDSCGLPQQGRLLRVQVRLR